MKLHGSLALENALDAILQALHSFSNGLDEL